MAQACRRIAVLSLHSTPKHRAATRNVLDGFFQNDSIYTAMMPLLYSSSLSNSFLSIDPLSYVSSGILLSSTKLSFT